MSDEERLRVLWESHARDVARYVRRRYRGPDVEDLVAEVFVVAWRRLGDVPSGHERAWLYRVAGNVLHHQYRTDADVARRVDAATAAALTTSTAVELVDDLDLRAALAGMRPDQLEVLLLAGWEGLDGPALAVALGCTATAARVRLHRARRVLTAALDGSADPMTTPSGQATPCPAKTGETR